MVRQGCFWALIATALCSPIAQAQSNKEYSTLMNKVDPCVVTIILDNDSEGSGFIIDGKGVIVTNYHVVEGAKSAKVIFADKKTIPAEGFLAINPAKDLALIKIPSRPQPYPSLQIAATTPNKGDQVFAFGAPLGLSGSVSNGIVAAIRPGTEVRETLERLAHRDIYTDTLRYDLDAQWIQSTAPISPGNSGGPLVNGAGEVVGINTWVCAAGQSLSFSLSAIHLRPFLANAPANSQPFAHLPPPRPGVGGGLGGNLDKTLTMWNSLNKSKYDLEKKISVLEKKLQQIVPIDPNNPSKGENSRNRKKIVIYDELSKIYREHADTVKALDNADVDSDAAKLVFAEAEVAQRTSDAYKNFSTAIATNAWHGKVHGEWTIDRLKDDSANLRTVYDLIRIKLNRRYSREFPTVKESGESTEEAPKAVAQSKSTPEASKIPNDSTNAIDNQDKLTVVRVWTDRSGRYQVQAKCLGIENGRVKLEKADGAVVFVPLTSLSEADQRFIGFVP